MPSHRRTPNKARWRWEIRGQVQGVGFRPFLYRVARESGVTGRVLNNAQGVHLEIQGDAGALATFEAGFEKHLPPLARVDACRRVEMALVPGEGDFVIEESAGAEGEVGGKTVEAAVAVDTAVCADCLREMFDPEDRRHLHALINCTNCGPRFSIVRDVPYDRANTTMASFAMCPACAAEYGDPGDRRFHAQPVCCPRCGPKVTLVTVTKGRARRVRGKPFEEAAKLLKAGKVVAIKGLGGFHLAVRADRAGAVNRLRKLKRRDAKPFALMVPDLAAASRLVELSAEAQRELASCRAPIVLAPRAASAKGIAPGVAPGTNLLGVMLPYTPVHYLLWRALAPAAKVGAGHCHAGLDMPFPLVMTSGNLSSEPLVIDNEDAVERLGPMCDAILWHNRPIERCVDDSVMLDRGAGREPLPIRRSRGFAPTATPLPQGDAQGGLCVGGELKNTVAVVRGEEVIVSQHLGDLSDARSYEHFRKAVDDLIRLFHVEVRFVAHDLHPNYMSTVAARQLAERFGVPLVPVQHHAAHAYAVMGEHHLERALAIICDGTGYGTDGTIWGGELLLVEGAAWRRLGRLRPMRLPGGDAAARDPRRSAMALLQQVFGAGFHERPEARRLFPAMADRRMLAHMITSGASSPWTSSTGRLFDAVAALLGVCLHNDHEAQAAMALEAAAWEGKGKGDGRSLDEFFDVRREGELWELDMGAWVRQVLGRKVESRRGRGGRAGNGHAGQVGELAWQFHRALAGGWCELLRRASDGLPSSGYPVVASGGTFCNRLLERELEEQGRAAGFSALFHKSYPPTDAGLAFGQAQFSRRQTLTS